jgi:hypothetical protein
VGRGRRRVGKARVFSNGKSDCTCPYARAYEIYGGSLAGTADCKLGTPERPVGCFCNSPTPLASPQAQPCSQVPELPHASLLAVPGVVRFSPSRLACGVAVAISYLLTTPLSVQRRSQGNVLRLRSTALPGNISGCHSSVNAAVTTSWWHREIGLVRAWGVVYPCGPHGHSRIRAAPCPLACPPSRPHLHLSLAVC